MITNENRHALFSGVTLIERSIARFNAYSLAFECIYDEGDKKCLQRLMNGEAHEIDNEFRRAAELLGYRVSKIEPEETVVGADLHAEAAE